MSVCLILSSASFTFASERAEDKALNNNQYVINDIETFKSEINSIKNIDNLSKKEKDEILSEVNPKIINDFVDEKIEKMQSELEKTPITTSRKEIDLGDNCKVIVSTTDAADNTINLPALKASTPGASTLWKDYGYRQFTVNYEMSIAVLNANLKLINHYTLSKNGIDLRYGEAEVGNPSFIGVNFGKATHETVVEHSSSAHKKGNSIKISAIYNFEYALPYGATITKNFKLYNNVKYSDIDLAGKQVKVVQSWSGDWL